MKEYTDFADWETELGAEVSDHLDWRESIMVEAFDIDGECSRVMLSPTDIKRLMQCVERWEADERSESIGKHSAGEEVGG